MSLDEQLEKLKIKKVLIVDDTAKNIEAAKQYFTNLNLEVDYASSEKEAISKLQKHQYDFIMTDQEMETRNSGVEVLKEAYKYAVDGVIVTGLNYQNSETDNHGPSTYIKSMHGDDTHFNGKKELPEIWEKCFEKSLDLLENSVVHKAMARVKKYVGVGPQFVEFLNRFNK